VPDRESGLTVIRAAEDLGYDSLWQTTHTAVPVRFESRYPYTPNGRPNWDATGKWGDPFVTLGFAAAVTERVRLGTSVVPLINTDPLTLAKQAATIDLLSKGRFELGIGAGWLVEEGQALGHPTDHRSARLEETIDILRRAWTLQTFSHDGRFWKWPELGVNPSPVQGGRLPIWVGGQNQRTVEIAARSSCGLLLWVVEPEEVRNYVRRLRELGGTGPVGAALRVNATKGRWLELWAAYRDAGADLLLLTNHGGRRLSASLEEFAKQVLAQARQ
jgi:probable F420-dependent oxidoreductase